MEETAEANSEVSEDVQIESLKRTMKEKCSKVQEKLSKINNKLDGTKGVKRISQAECIPSTSKSTSAGYLPQRKDMPNMDERLKIKQKINTVKRKFAKINMKINGALENTSEKEAGEGVLRCRSNSERSSIVSEQSQAPEVQRSQSVTMPTISMVSEEDVNEAIRESKKSRRKHRKNQVREWKNERIVEDVYKLEIGGELKLNTETLLILDLLSLPEDKREDFLINRAKDIKVLIENPESRKLEVHPKIAKLQSVLCRGKKVWELDDSVRQRVQYIANSKSQSQKIEQAKKEKARPIFEQLINAVVWEGLSEEQQEQFTFPITSKKQRTKNYFCSNSFTSSLEAFAQKCVDANLGVIIEGEIRVNAKNNDQAFIKHVQGEKDAMFSSQLIRKCALHGDIVRAFIRIQTNDNNKDTSTDGNATLDCVGDEDDDEPLEIVPERSAKGFVIKILEEVHNRRCVGSFLSYRLDSEYITFVPRDMKMPNMRIYREHWPESFAKGNMENIQDILYVAVITDWSGDICIGKILQAVGKCGELESENNAILLQNKLSVTPYDEKFNQMFYGPIMITEEERKKRVDLTAECIFTIDPLTARDLDDAMSCKLLPNGNYEIGVHISDVAYFLQEDSELDRIVQQRTTSVYMVNEVFHMLPKPLCLKCSLLPGDEKLAFSVIWELTPTAEIISTRFFRSIINSCTQLAYEHAQKIIDYPDKDFNEKDFPTIYNGFTASDIVEKVKALQSIALILRKKRFDNGAIKINRPKLYFELDPQSGAPANYGVCQLDTANFLIEEFMLLANQSVAKFTYDKFPELSMLRNHDPPVSNVIKDLKERLTSLGLELNISSSKSIYESLLKLVSESENKDIMEICLSHIISKPMTRAKYFCSGSKESETQFWHYALSIPIYTHFTSPIRRYPDVLVHRVLSAALGYTSPPKRTPKELQEIAGICNEHKFNAKNAGDDSSNLYFLHYIKSKKFLTVRAAVLDMWLHAMEVILIETGHLVRVPYPKEGKGNAKIILNNKTKPYTAQLIFTNIPNSTPKELKMFSEILVEIYVEKNKLKGRIAVPATPPSENAPEQSSKTCQDNANLSCENTTKSEEGIEATELEKDKSVNTSVMKDESKLCEMKQSNVPQESSALLVKDKLLDRKDDLQKVTSQDRPQTVENIVPKTSESVVTRESSEPTTKLIKTSDVSSSENVVELALESKQVQQMLRKNSEREQSSLAVSTGYDINVTQYSESEQPSTQGFELEFITTKEIRLQGSEPTKELSEKQNIVPYSSESESSEPTIEKQSRDSCKESSQHLEVRKTSNLCSSENATKSYELLTNEAHTRDSELEFNPTKETKIQASQCVLNSTEELSKKEGIVNISENIVTNKSSEHTVIPTIEAPSHDFYKESTLDRKVGKTSEVTSSENTSELSLESKQTQQRLRKDSENEEHFFEVSTQPPISELKSTKERDVWSVSQTEESSKLSIEIDENLSQDKNLVNSEEPTLILFQSNNDPTESKPQLLTENLESSIAVNVSDESLNWETPPMSPTT